MAEPEGNRKLAAILAADVANFSRLMQDDERATVATLDAYRGVFRQQIEAHQGRVVDMAGDSVLAAFDTATGAVRAALDIQTMLGVRNESLADARRMLFRIGVNLGEVIQKQDGTIYGDGVNIAARLESIGQPGGVTVSGTVFDQVKNRLRAEFDSLGEQTVKNIVGPVRAYRVRTPTGDASESAQSVKSAVMPKTVLSLPDKPSIAVLPFVNMSGDKEQEYFSDGMTEDVITGLSKRSGLFVIARNSVFTYKGRAVKPEQIGGELGVRYILEGSVRKAGNRVRITAQLIDATTGYHLWAEKYDGELKDVFALQDGITQQIVTALAPKLTAGERSPSVRQETNSIEAYDHFLRGFALFYKYRKESNAMARQMFGQALALDPNYARAYVWLSWVHFIDWEFQWTEGPDALDRSHEAARKAVTLDDSLSDAHTVFGWTSLWKRQHDVAIAELERAVALDPNSEWAYAFLAQVLNYSGRPDEAIGFAKKAMRLDPNYPPWLVFHLADSYYLLRRYGDAVDALHDALQRNPDFLPARRVLAIIHAELGEHRQARAEVTEILRISPAASLGRWRERMPYRIETDLARYIAGLQKAGLK
jgi:adenylate cyclase